MYRTQRPAILGAVTAVLLAATGAAGAISLDEELEAVRDQIMTQRQNPDSFETQRRGGVSGGSFSVRNPKTQKQPWYQIQTPQLEAGCGGIDAYGGSMSFLSSDQLRSQLQSMAGPQIVTYALGVALDIMAPTLAAEMKRLQRLLNQWNEALKDECKMAQMITKQSGLEGMARESRQEAQWLGKRLGNFNDEFESSFSPESEVDGGTTRQERKEEEIVQNIMWEAMKEANIQSWRFPGDRAGDTSFKEFLMNLTGTVTVTYKEDGENPDPDPYLPTIHPDDLIKGFEGEQHVLTCPDDACLEPESTEVSNFEGMEGIILEAFFLGSANKAPLYDLFRDPSLGGITESQKALLHLSQTPSASLMRAMAIEGEAPAAGTPQVLSRRVAYEIVESWVSELYMQAEAIALDHDMSEDIMEKLRSWREMSMRRLESVRKSLRDNAEFYNYYNEVREALGRTSDLRTTRAREIMQQQSD